MRKSQEFFIVFSPRAGVLQFCELCKLGPTWMFLLIFWGKGLLCWFSGVVSLAVLHCPCQGGRAVSYAPDYSMWLLFPEGFPHHFRGWEWKCEPPSVQPWSWILAPSVPSRRSCQTLLSPWFLSALCVHTACDRAFLSQPCHPLWSFQTLLPPVACIHTAPPGGGREVLPWVCCLLCHHSESSRPNQGSSWFMTTPIWSPLLHSLVAASFPAQMSGNSPTLRQPCSFCDSRNPEPRLSHPGFHPASPPECLSRRDDPHRSRLLKVPICTRLLYHFLKAGLWMLPPLMVYLPIYPLGFTSLHLLPCRKWSLFYL